MRRAFLPSLLLLGSVLSAQPRDLRVGVQGIGATTAYLAAVDQGYFAAEGLAPQATRIDSGSRAIQALSGGSLDVTLAATLSVLQAVGQGLELRIVAPGSFMAEGQPINALVVRADSVIRDARGLAGKTVAVNALGSVNDLMTREYLARGGADPAQVTFVEMPFSAMAVALEHGRVDAAQLVEPSITALVGPGKARVLCAGQDVLPGASLSVYVATRAWVEANRATAQAFARAAARGGAYCQAQPGRARALLAADSGLPAELVDRIALHSFRPALVEKDVARLQELAVRHGLLRQAVRVETLLVH
jgi:NitT/TauT family transport system substrate-binding protein